MRKYKGLLHLITRAVEKEKGIKDIELAVGTDVIVDKLLMDIGNTVQLGRASTFRFLKDDNRKEFFIREAKNERYTYTEEFHDLVSDIMAKFDYIEDEYFVKQESELTIYKNRHYATKLEGAVEDAALFHSKTIGPSIKASLDNLPVGIALIYFDDNNELACSNTMVSKYMEDFIKVSMVQEGNRFYFDIDNKSEFILACKYIKNGRSLLYVNVESIDNMRIGNIEKKLGMRSNILGLLNPGEKGFSTVEEAEKALAERKPVDKIISIKDTKELEKKEDIKLTDTSKELIVAKKHNVYLRQEKVSANNSFYGLAGFGAAKPVARQESFTEAKPVEVSGSILRKNDKRVSGMTGANWFNNLMLNKTKKD